VRDELHQSVPGVKRFRDHVCFRERNSDYPSDYFLMVDTDMASETLELTRIIVLVVNGRFKFYRTYIFTYLCLFNNAVNSLCNIRLRMVVK
jgi:hypothetical protein